MRAAETAHTPLVLLPGGPRGGCTENREMGPSDRARGRRRRRQLLALTVLAVIGIGAGQLSLALFTDQETVAGTFSTGSIILDDVKIDALTLSTGAMMPGDAITDDVVVENDGTAQLRYSMT